MNRVEERCRIYRRDVVDSFVRQSLQRLLVFTSKPRFIIKGFLCSKRDAMAGVDIKELLKLKDNISVVGVVDENLDSDVLIVTAKGNIKKISLKEFKGVKTNGASLFSLRKGDTVSYVYVGDLKYITTIEAKGDLKVVDTSALVATPRAKAPEKMLDGVMYSCPLGSKDLKPKYVYPDGRMSFDKIAKTKPCGLVYESARTQMEFVALSSKSRTFLIDYNLDKIELEPQEKIEAVFCFNCIRN